MSEQIVILDEQPAAKGYLSREDKGPVYLKYSDRDPRKFSAIVGELEKIEGGWNFKPLGWELKNPITGKTSVAVGKDAFLAFMYSNFRPVLEDRPEVKYN